jgi:tetratricopeptide (TPR) repeat protein
MLERFAHTEDANAAANVLTACVLRDDAIPDMARLLSLTRLSNQRWHWGAGVHGAALYRARMYQECLESFEVAARIYRPRAWDWCFLAMAHHRLGHADEARRCLSEAARWIEEANRHEGDDPSGTQPVWGGWNELAVYPLLLREAQELLKKDPREVTAKLNEVSVSVQAVLVTHASSHAPHSVAEVHTSSKDLVRTSR